MDSKWEYVSLSKRFESFAERATDPRLAAAYRSLAEHYRVLDEWRQKMGDRYETADSPPATTTPADQAGRQHQPGHPPSHRKRS